MDTVETRVKAVIASCMGVGTEEVKPESRFEQDLQCDSLDKVEIAMALEEEFGTEIADDVLEKIETVQQAVDILTAKAH